MTLTLQRLRHLAAYTFIYPVLLMMACQTANARCAGFDDVRTTLNALTVEVPSWARSAGWFEISKRMCTNVTWSGETRPLDPKSEEFIRTWAVEAGVRANVRELFKHEILVTENGQEYWLVIQEQLIPYLVNEVPVGEDVTLQLKRYGALEGGDIVFGVQEFQAGKTVIPTPKTPPTDTFATTEKDTSIILQDLVQNHPSKEVRELMNQWIEEAHVNLSGQAESNVSEMAVALADVGGKLEPVLFYNDEWMRERSYVDARLNRLKKQLVLYHEFQHLKDHFDGTVLLLELVLDREEVEANIEDYAENIWNAEYGATLAEWRLANELGVPELMSGFSIDPESANDERVFLDAFYKLFSGSVRNIRDADLTANMQDYWKEIYAREVRRLEATKEDEESPS